MAALRQLAQQQGQDLAVWKFMSAGNSDIAAGCLYAVHALRCACFALCLHALRQLAQQSKDLAV